MNIVFIGMPGSGKTTLGKIVAEKLNKDFYDLDKIIECKENMSITDIFRNGEDYFRNLEYKYLSEISKNDNIVIATGGGTIVKTESTELIKNDYVIFLDRSIDDIISSIDNDDRPLLLGDVRKNLENLYERRIHKYESICDYKVKVSDINETVLNILEQIKREVIWKFYLYLVQI